MQMQNIREAAERYNRRATAEGWKTRADATLAFERSVLSDLLTLWKEKAATGLPRRDAFDARSLKPVLPRLCIAEKLNDGSWRWRLFGTGLAGMVGEYTGKLMHEVLPPEHVERWAFTYDCCIDALVPMRFISDFQLSKIEHLSGETMVLPVADDKGEPRLVFAMAYVRLKDTQDSPKPAQQS